MSVELSEGNASVVEAAVVSDDDGSRRLMMLLPAGVRAEARGVEGTGAELSGLTLRMAEYTVGKLGRVRMPAELPPASGYTFAFGISADEAPEGVDFDRAVPVYVDNFLAFPAGTKVPLGYYDEQQGVWVDEESGLVVDIVSVAGGVAALDVDGDGRAEDAAELLQYGIDRAELENLAARYAGGTSLWRLPLRHLSSWDANWGVFPPEDAAAPAGPAGGKPDDGCEQDGSRIVCNRQVLGEDLPLAGVPFSLHYRSDRVRGRRAEYSLRIPLRGPEVPASLRAIRLRVEVAGRTTEESFGPDPDPASDYDWYDFEWDGKDAYGRTVQGLYPVRVAVGYVYRGVYQQTERFGETGEGVEITGDAARGEIVLWRRWREWLGVWEARAMGLGGWTLSVHHAFLPDAGVIFLGDGTRRRAEDISWIIETVAGDGGSGPSDKNDTDNLATEVSMGSLEAMVATPDGGLLLLDGGLLWSMGRDGRLTFLGGGAHHLEAGEKDNVPNVNLEYCGDMDIGPDGSIYLVQYGDSRVLRIKNKLVEVFAGTGEDGYGGDGGPASEAVFDRPKGIAVAADGNVYVADSNNCVVRRISPSGRITLVAGRPGVCDENSGDGGPAREATFNGEPDDVAVGPDGAVYIAVADRVRRVSPSGFIDTVAGGGEATDEGIAATDFDLGEVAGIAVATDGTLYISRWDWGSWVMQVTPDGVISTLAGVGEEGPLGDGGPAAAAQLHEPYRISVGPDGAVYFIDGLNYRVRRVRKVFAANEAQERVIPSASGDEVYLFDRRGRHLRTQDAWTGATRWEFGYDDQGRLESITDAYSNVTRIEHDDAAGRVTIRPPEAPATVIVLNAAGYAESISDPAGNTHRFRYDVGGLLTEMTDPNGQVHSFDYGSQGSLAKDSFPDGGSKTLSFQRLENGQAVRVTTALGLTSRYTDEYFQDGSHQRRVTFPDGTINRLVLRPDGSQELFLADGNQLFARLTPDPRFGMVAPLLGEYRKELPFPSQLVFTVTHSRRVEPEDASDMAEVTSITDEYLVNDRLFVERWDAGQRRRELTTPEGRKFAATLNARGLLNKLQWPESVQMALEFNYDSYGRLSRLRLGNEVVGRSYFFGYDDHGYLAWVEDPLGHREQYEHDAAGRVTVKHLADGRKVRLDYDANGNVVAVIPPGRPAHVFEYDGMNRLSAYRPPAVEGGGATRYSYDVDGKLVGIERPDGKRVSIGYDDYGRMVSASGPERSNRAEWNPQTGLPARVESSDGVSIDLTWEGDKLTWELWQGPFYASVYRRYDSDMRLAELSWGGPTVIRYGYDQDGLLVEAGDMSISRETASGLIAATTLGGVTTGQGYTIFGELENFSSQYQGSELFSYTLGRDESGRITSKREVIGGEEHNWEYFYDEAGRLVESRLNGRRYEQIEYDANSNRIAYTGPEGSTITADYDDQDRLLRYGETIFSYTANGELLTKTDATGTTTYTYDVFGNLTDVVLPTGKHIHYLIDGRNRRVGKEVDGVVEYYLVYSDQLRPILQLDADGNVVSEFIYATHVNVPDYMLKGGHTYRIVTDHLGSVRLVVDRSTGSVAQRIDYDPWGVVLTDTNPGFQPFGFGGGLYDQYTGLVRFGARDYDAVCSRWQQRDDLSAFAVAGNHYIYIGDNPINNVDPYGLEPPYFQTTSDWLRDNIWNSDAFSFAEDEQWAKKADMFMTIFCIAANVAVPIASKINPYAGLIAKWLQPAIITLCSSYDAIRILQ